MAPIALRFLALTVILSSIAIAQPLEGLWSLDYSIEGPDAPTEFAINFQGHLIIAGDFTMAGATNCQRVAWFDGSEWASFDSEPDGEVLGFVEHEGALLALVRRMQGNEVLSRRIWILEGTHWSPYSEEIADEYPTGSLVSYQGGLYKGGHLWNGTAFVDALQANGAVLALVEHDGLLVAGGSFSSCGGTALGRLVAWDGSEVSRPWPAVDSTVRHLSTRDTDLVALTDYWYIYRNVFCWDGSSWEEFTLDDPLVGRFTFSHLGELYAACDRIQEDAPPYMTEYYLLRWDGDDWVSAVPGQCRAYAATSWNDGIVIGCDDYALGQHRLGHVFHMPDPPAPDPVVSIGRTGWGVRHGTIADLDVGTDLYVVGTLTDVGGTIAENCATFDGTTWIPRSFSGYNPPFEGSGMYAVLEQDGLHGAGFRFPGHEYVRWNGSGWSYQFEIEGYWLMARAGGEPYGCDEAHVYHLVESNPLIGTSDGGVIRALGEWEGDLIVGGSFPTIGGVDAAGLCRWHDGQWYDFAVPYGAGVYELGSWDGRLVAASGLPASVRVVSAWTDGEGWEVLGGEFDGPVNALVEYEGYLFAGGDFGNVGGVDANRIAAWDGESWRPVGEGTDAPIADMVAWNDRLWIGGEFTVAGGVMALGLTNWRALTPANANAAVVASAPLMLETPHPNPFNPRTTLRFRVPSAGHAKLTVFDLRGRLVRSLVDRTLTAGPHAADWDGRDRSGMNVAAGVYIAQLQSGSYRATTRLTLVR